MALYIPGAESLSPDSTFEKLSHISSLAWSSISLPCHRADDTEWGRKKPHRSLVIMEQKKDRFCSLSLYFSDTLKIKLAGFNYLFNDVMSSHGKDVEGKITSFIPKFDWRNWTNEKSQRVASVQKELWNWDSQNMKHPGLCSGDHAVHWMTWNHIYCWPSQLHIHYSTVFLTLKYVIILL